MGLPVIGRIADGVTVVTDAGGTRLSMRFHLANGRGEGRSSRPCKTRSMALEAR